MSEHWWTVLTRGHDSREKAARSRRPPRPQYRGPSHPSRRTRLLPATRDPRISHSLSLPLPLSPPDHLPWARPQHQHHPPPRSRGDRPSSQKPGTCSSPAWAATPSGGSPLPCTGVPPRRPGSVRPSPSSSSGHGATSTTATQSPPTSSSRPSPSAAHQISAATARRHQTRPPPRPSCSRGTPRSGPASAPGISSASPSSSSGNSTSTS